MLPEIVIRSLRISCKWRVPMVLRSVVCAKRRVEWWAFSTLAIDTVAFETLWKMGKKKCPMQLWDANKNKLFTDNKQLHLLTRWHYLLSTPAKLNDAQESVRGCVYIYFKVCTWPIPLVVAHHKSLFANQLLHRRQCTAKWRKYLTKYKAQTITFVVNLGGELRWIGGEILHLPKIVDEECASAKSRHFLNSQSTSRSLCFLD